MYGPICLFVSVSKNWISSTGTFFPFVFSEVKKISLGSLK